MKFARHILIITAFVLPLPAALIAQHREASTTRFTSGPSTKLAIDIDNNIILMKVRVNGSRPLRFIFDTGASMSAIDQHFVSELGLKVSDTVKGKAPGAILRDRM